jgi:hypothetical protein
MFFSIRWLRLKYIFTYHNIMNLIIHFADFFIHLDKYLPLIIQSFGVWAYVIIFLVIFCETGLVVTSIRINKCTIL